MYCLKTSNFNVSCLAWIKFWESGSWNLVLDFAVLIQIEFRGKVESILYNVILHSNIIKWNCIGIGNFDAYTNGLDDLLHSCYLVNKLALALCMFKERKRTISILQECNAKCWCNSIMCLMLVACSFLGTSTLYLETWENVVVLQDIIHPWLYIYIYIYWP